jgi:hypothetical protein
MLSFAFKIAINATSLNALLGYKKKGSFPLSTSKKKNPHPSLLIFHFFKRNFSSLHINLRSSNSFSNQKTFLQFLSFWLLELGSVGRGEKVLL